jgi:hypothetical protein
VQKTHQKFVVTNPAKQMTNREFGDFLAFKGSLGGFFGFFK